jgi:hypothetical protein
MIEDMTIRTNRRSAAILRQRGFEVQTYFGRSPERIALQVHLVLTGILWAGLNQIACALRSSTTSRSARRRFP